MPLQFSRKRGKLCTPPSRQASPPPWLGVARILPCVCPVKKAARTVVVVAFLAPLAFEVDRLKGLRKLPASSQAFDSIYTASPTTEAGTSKDGDVSLPYCGA